MALSSSSARSSSSDGFAPGDRSPHSKHGSPSGVATGGVGVTGHSGVPDGFGVPGGLGVTGGFGATGVFITGFSAC